MHALLSTCRRLRSAAPFDRPAPGDGWPGTRRDCRTRKILCLILGLGAAALDFAGACADTVFVTLEKENALAVIDGTRGELLRKVPAGKRPRGIVAGRDGKALFVASSDENRIALFDAATLSGKGELPVDRDPKTIALNPSGTRLFAADDDNNQLTVVDTGSREILRRIAVGREPEGVAISPDGRWVISTSEADATAWWIDAETLASVAQTKVDPRPRYSRFTDDGQQLWVSSHDGPSVTVIDVATRQPIKRIGFEIAGVSARDIGPVGIRIDHARRFAYVALGRADRIAQIDAQTFEVLRYLPVGRRVWNLEFSPDQQRLYAANGLSHGLSVISLPQFEVTRTIPVGEGPWGIAVLP